MCRRCAGRCRRSGSSAWSNARGNNLKSITAGFPLGTFTCVTGVSGGGKSTLVVDTLYKAAARRLMGAGEVPAPHDRIEGLELLDKIIDIDQSPIGRTPRSNPATYTDLFAPIRDWFAELPESRARGYKPGRFSFNVKGGRCEACQGDGVLKIEMHFLPDVYVTCDVCKGRRYNRETLEIKFRDKSIAEVLALTVDEAVPYFSAQTRIHDRLRILQQVGLGYIALGQQATTLSGGEAQRIKLSKELARRATGRTLYILDEPTTGLHFEDVRKLLEVLHALVDQGNTVVVIEHNLEVIKTADWILDLGPEGGDGGGRIVAEGTPEDIAANPQSHTGRFLAPLLQSGETAAGAPPRLAGGKSGHRIQHHAQAAIQHLLAPQHDAELAPDGRTQPSRHRSRRQGCQRHRRHDRSAQPATDQHLDCLDAVELHDRRWHDTGARNHASMMRACRPARFVEDQRQPGDLCRRQARRVARQRCRQQGHQRICHQSCHAERPAAGNRQSHQCDIQLTGLHMARHVSAVTGGDDNLQTRHPAFHRGQDRRQQVDTGRRTCAETHPAGFPRAMRRRPRRPHPRWLPAHAAPAQTGRHRRRSVAPCPRHAPAAAPEAPAPIRAIAGWPPAASGSASGPPWRCCRSRQPREMSGAAEGSVEA